MWWCWWLTLAWPCETESNSTELSAAVAEAEGTFASLDMAAFKAATDRIQTVLPCMVDPVPSNVAAEVHRYLGIRAVGDRDLEVAAQRFAAARVLEPDYDFPLSLIPEGNPVRTAYTRLSLDDPQYEDVPPPADGGYLQFDGRISDQRARAWHTLVQRFDGTGRVVETRDLSPSDPLPVYPVRVAGPVEPGTVDEPEADRPKALLAATVAMGLTSAVLYGAAGLTEARFKDPATPDDRLDPLAKQANGLVIASGVGSAAALGLGVGLAIRW